VKIPGTARVLPSYCTRSFVLNSALPPFLVAVLASDPSRQRPAVIAHWFNVEVIQLLAHHTSAVIAAVVLFWMVGWLVRRLVHDSVMKRAVLLLDEVVLLAIFVYFAYELLFLLYLRTRNIGAS
jgi:heme A synthase